LAFASRSAPLAVFFKGFATGLGSFVALVGFGGDSFEGFANAGGDSLKCFFNGGGETFAGFCGGGGKTFDGFCPFGGGFSTGALLLLTVPNARRVGLERSIPHLNSETNPSSRNKSGVNSHSESLPGLRSVIAVAGR
jgi:hypothetical protein